MLFLKSRMNHSSELMRITVINLFISVEFYIKGKDAGLIVLDVQRAIVKLVIVFF